MKGAVLRRVGEPMAIEDVDIDKPGPREVLVRIAAVGLCHSDLHVMDGVFPHPLPVLLGHEAAGVVEQVGAEVRTLASGDHVVVCLCFHCGRCEYCLSGHMNLCMPIEAARGPDHPVRLSAGGGAVRQFANIGAFAEQILLHESGCVRIRQDMPLDRACLIGCAVTTGLGAVLRTARVSPGATVAILGCGGVGLSAVNGAALAGAGRIIAIDVAASKLALASSFGATDVVDARNGDVVAQVAELTRGRGVDHAIEAIGRKDTIEQAFAMLGKRGVATVVGVTSPSVKIELPAFALLQEKRIQGSMMGGVRSPIDIPQYIDHYMRGRLHIDALISQRLSLEGINEGFAAMRSGAVARSVIVFET